MKIVKFEIFRKQFWVQLAEVANIEMIMKI